MGICKNYSLDEYAREAEGRVKIMKSFKCYKCGFFFSLESDFENMSKEEYKEVKKCPCGEQMEEVEYSVDMIPNLEL